MDALARFVRRLPLLVLFFSPLHASEITATADTWIQAGNAERETNFGSEDSLKVRARGQRIALIRFDTSALPQNPEPNATLSIHVSQVTTGGEIQIRRVTSAWDESIVTFKTRPTLAAEAVATRTVTSANAGTRVSFDISSLFAEWTANPGTNFGLAITARGSQADVRFGARESGTPPMLIVATQDSVLVSKNGGDYSDPIAAARNAFDGDRWCVDGRPPAEPCVMRVDGGIFVLSETLVVPDNVIVTGEGKTATILVADRGLELAVESHTSEISELTIINRQDESVSRAVGLRVLPTERLPGLTLTRVTVRAEGAVDNIGFVKRRRRREYHRRVRRLSGRRSDYDRDRRQSRQCDRRRA